MEKFLGLHKEIENLNPRLGIFSLFKYLREKYHKKILKDELLVRKMEVAEIPEYPVKFYYENHLPKVEKEFQQELKKSKELLENISEDLGLRWDDVKFHEEYRVISYEGFKVLLSEVMREALWEQLMDQKISLKEFDDALQAVKRLEVPPILEDNLKVKLLKEKFKGIKDVLGQGFQMSILPLNMLLPIEVLIKFVPEQDYFSYRPPDVNPDPYGHEDCRIRSKGGIILGTYKFKHSLLMDISDYCPIGCVGCYKTFYTREPHWMGVSKKTLELQAQGVVEWLNSNPQVYDLIISGGEPLLVDYDNERIELLLYYLKKAEHLKIVRICTGVIFQGLPFRIDSELLRLIDKFVKETGKRFTFQAHLSNHFQFTPEAMRAIKIVREHAINIYSQVPIQEGVNFFLKDEEKTLKFFRKLGKIQVLAEVKPYKYIVDMHPRTQKRYVPLERILKIWRLIGESHLFPELERPKTLSILTKEGNIILSWYMLKHMQKIKDEKRNKIIYKIPAITGISEKEKIVTYEEPIRGRRKFDNV